MADKPQIIVSAPAEADLQQVIDYLAGQWSVEMSIKFIDRYFHKLDLIESMPGFGILSSKVPNVRKVKIDKYNVICYRVTDAEITILRILDTRSNPADNPY